jgi:dTDP-4-amino-4,6-dideoxygalactose transaminase
MHIPFNKPFFAGQELGYITKAVQNGHISGNGAYSKKVQAWFKQELGLASALLTTSCTDALEMSALLLDIQPGDEVILPSYTFVSTANAFALRGAKLIFADSRSDRPGLDERELEALIGPKTKCIVPVHYAGVACQMDAIMDLAKRKGIRVVEDAAQAIDSFFIDANGLKRPLGSIGQLSAFSFHETKNIMCGEGGLLAVNDPQFSARAEIIWEKGTNRSQFFRGEADKYGWVDIGSSFLASDLNAAFLYAQLESMAQIQERRKQIWQRYFEGLKELGGLGIQLPYIPEYATNNGHMFYLVCRSGVERDALIAHLKHHGIHAVFHYQSLHASPYFSARHDGRQLVQSDRYSECLLRLPFYYELGEEDQNRVVEQVWTFYSKATL